MDSHRPEMFGDHGALLLERDVQDRARLDRAPQPGVASCHLQREGARKRAFAGFRFRYQHGEAAYRQHVIYQPGDALPARRQQLLDRHEREGPLNVSSAHPPV